MRPAVPRDVVSPLPMARTVALATHAVATPYRNRDAAHLALRDAAVATALLLLLVGLGSGGFASFDTALLGYFGATLVSAFAFVWKASAFWRRPASAFYGRALLAALSDPRSLRRSVFAAGRDLAAQDFIRRRSWPRWIAHLLLSMGVLVSFAITVPLVFGWTHFVNEGERFFRLIVFTVPTVRFDVSGVFGWIMFHALSLAAVAVVLGALYFLAVRLRHRRLPGATSSFAIAPLVLLLSVALSGLALPATHGWPAAFQIAAWVHEACVIVLLVALPFSKMSHVIVRPLQIGVRAVRSRFAAWSSCPGCGDLLAPTAQQRAVAALLEQRGLPSEVVRQCTTCRRKQLARAQAVAVRAYVQPTVSGSQREGW